MSGSLPITGELWIDGIRYPDGQPGEDPVNPFAVSGLRIGWGRATTVDQPAPSMCTFTIMDPPGGSVRFDSTVNLGSTVVVWAEYDGRRVVVFGGRVSDLTASFDDAAGSGICEVIAADLMSDLANRFVGAEPWAAETLTARASRILTAIGVPTSTLSIDARLGAVRVSRVDVDRQAAAGLLTELATTTGGVLWASYDPVTNLPFLWFEDPSLRASLYGFVQGTDLLWRPAQSAGAGTPLSACEVLQDPVKWVRAVTDQLTRVTVRWLDQSTTPDVTERSYAIVNSGAEVTYGARGLSVGTLLTYDTDAAALATGLLASHSPGPTWGTDGLTWDLSMVETPNDPDTVALALDLLDNTDRPGTALALGDLPYWTPTAAAVQLYVEGGSYEFTDGFWTLSLNAAAATGLGSSLSYGQTDLSVRYADIDPAVTFLDMIGVGRAAATGPDWNDLTGTWNDLTTDWMNL